LQRSADSKENRLPAYVILTREKTRNESQLNEYRQLVPASFQKHPAKFRAIHGRHQVLEGSAIEEIVILEFPCFEDATAWYHSPAYQAAANTASRAAITAASSPRASLLNLDPVRHLGSPS
jgi:uncharacterized protein (DUF1330 family)